MGTINTQGKIHNLGYHCTCELETQDQIICSLQPKKPEGLRTISMKIFVLETNRMHIQVIFYIARLLLDANDNSELLAGK